VTASPISDMNPVLLAAGATLGCRSVARGAFTLPLASFFIAYRETALPPDAVITHIHIPLAKPDILQVMKAYKQAKRKDDDIAIVTGTHFAVYSKCKLTLLIAAFRVRLSDDGLVQEVSLAYGGMAAKTVEAVNTMTLLLGR
jgi:xanthine dehydrogenase/oxidase